MKRIYEIERESGNSKVVNELYSLPPDIALCQSPNSFSIYTQSIMNVDISHGEHNRAPTSRGIISTNILSVSMMSIKHCMLRVETNLFQRE